MNADGQTLLAMVGHGYLLGGDLLASRVLAHELTHQLAATLYLRQPRWLAEGLAEYLETIEVDVDKREASLGRPVPGLRDYLRDQGISDVGHLWEWDTEALPPDADALYAASWLLVDYLATFHPEKFEDFDDRLIAGEEPRAAFAAAFATLQGAPLKEQLEEHAHRRSYLQRRVSWKGNPTAPRIAPLSDAAVHLLRADLLAGRGAGNSAAQAEEIHKALAHEPRLVEARVREISLAPLGAQSSLADRLVADLPEDASAWFVFHATRADPAEKERALRRVLELDPTHAGANHSLALLLMNSGRASEAESLVRLAVQRRPLDFRYRMTLGVILAGQARCAEALREMRRAADCLGDNASREVRAELVALLRSFDAGCQ